jgi:hypothetical protein
MNDDKQKNDDSFDDDLDFDDLDEEDAPQDSWEDLEDLEADETEPASQAQSGVKKKSFIQKNFNAIVIAVVVVGGGLFLLPGLLKSPSADPANETAAQEPDPIPQAVSEGELQQGELPPMPTPINSAPEDLAQIPQEDPVLTPLPDTSADVAPLPDLALEPDINLQPSESEPSPAVESPPIEKMPEVAQVAEALEVIEAPEPMPVIAEVPDAPPVQEPQNTQEMLAMEAELGSANAKIEELNATLSDLQKQIEALELAKAQNNQAEQAVEKPRNAPAPESKPAKPKSEKTKSAAATPKKQAAQESGSAAKWVLRSAQSGTAIIAPQGGNDFVRVAVGDNFPGLGKIVSITQENGRWVVKGSQGEVRQ